MKFRHTKLSITIIILVILAALLVVIATVSQVLNIADYCDLGGWELCGSVWDAVAALSTLLAAIFAICAYDGSVDRYKKSLINYLFFKDFFGGYDLYARLIRDTVSGNVYETFKEN